jgi:hypothetical protein
MAYGFAPGVFACLADGRLVLLNVAADRYLMLPRIMEASLLRLIEGAPDDPTDRAVRERLCTNGLILQRTPISALTLCQEPLPSRSLLDAGPPPARLRQIARAGAALVRASAMLRIRGLDGSLRCLAGIRPPPQNDVEGVERKAAAFAGMRVFVRALDRCLPLSMALTASAKLRHANVKLVLGVRCHPFAAHAWVQLGPTVLNDRLDTVRSFTPILAQ